MIKGIKILLAAFALSITFAACTSEAQNEISKPLADAKTKVENTVKNAKEQISTTNDKKKGDAKVSLSADRPATAITFSELEHHFGTIDEGDKVEHIFTFKNTGNEPLILEKCKGSCGCTVPTCPKEPIMPGASGEIKVIFNSRGKKNHQEKRVTITANTEPIQTVLKIIADVTPDPEAAAKAAAKKAAAKKAAAAEKK